MSLDTVITRQENEYWKIEVSEFQSWIPGFYKFEGEWMTTELADSNIQIIYTYTLFARNNYLYPFNYLFAKYFWKSYMKRVLENVRRLAYNQTPYIYR